MTPDQIQRMKTACEKALEAAHEIVSLADEMERHDEQHDVLETGVNIRNEAEVSIDWMNRLLKAVRS